MNSSAESSRCRIGLVPNRPATVNRDSSRHTRGHNKPCEGRVMGRYSSDSEEERKKRKKKKKKKSRSRSGSIDSRHSTKLKKSKKSKRKHRSRSRSRSRSPDRYKKSRSSRSRSRSYDRYRSRSRSRSRDRHRRRSRSLSRDRYSRSRSRERRRRRSRSRSRSYERSRRSRSYSPSRRSKRDRTSVEREDPCSSIPGFSEMTSADQARIRMHMALKAAAAADEKLKGEVPRNQSSNSLQESLQFSQAIQDIESSGFAATSFKSTRTDKKDEPVTVKDEFTFGTAGELRLDPTQRKPVIVNVETDELAHPSLYADPEEKLDRWIQKLTAMRRKKLEGEALA